MYHFIEMWNIYKWFCRKLLGWYKKQVTNYN